MDDERNCYSVQSCDWNHWSYLSIFNFIYSKKLSGHSLFLRFLCFALLKSLVCTVDQVGILLRVAVVMDLKTIFHPSAIRCVKHRGKLE